MRHEQAPGDGQGRPAQEGQDPGDDGAANDAGARSQGEAPPGPHHQADDHDVEQQRHQQVPRAQPAVQELGRGGTGLGLLLADLLHQGEQGRARPQEDLQGDGAADRRATPPAQAVGQDQLQERRHAHQELLDGVNDGVLGQDGGGQPVAGVSQGAGGVTHDRQGAAHGPAGHQEGHELALHAPGQLLGGGRLLPALQDDAHDEADDAGAQAGQGAHGSGHGGRDDEDGEGRQARAPSPGRAHDAGGGRHQAGDGQADALNRGVDEVGGPGVPHAADEGVERLGQDDASGAGDDGGGQPPSRAQEPLQQHADGQQHEASGHRQQVAGDRPGGQ